MIENKDNKENPRRAFLKTAVASAVPFAFPLTEILTVKSNALASKKTPVIVLRSSWQEVNIGDIGHTPGTLRLLERHVPEAEVLLWHTDPRPKTEKIVAKNFPKVKVIRGPWYNGDKPFEGEVKDAFDRADLFIMNSGMHYNYGLFNYDWPKAMAALTPFYYCLDKKIPFGMYGQSFDKMAHPSMPVFKDILSKSAFIYCRDTESQKFLKQNNFHPSILEFGPDGCFGIDVRDEEKGLAYLKKAGLEDQKFLVVIIRTNTPKLGATGSGDLLNPVQATPEQQEQDRKRIPKVIEMITSWVRETGLKVLIAPEMDKEMIPAKTMIVDHLDNDVKQKVIVRDTFWNADEAMSVYARAHSMFGMEPHSLIMGMALGVPVLHVRSVSHGRKGWMFRDIGVPEWLFEIDESKASEWMTQLLKIHKDYSFAKAKVKKAMAFVNLKQTESMAAIRKIVVLPTT